MTHLFPIDAVECPENVSSPSERGTSLKCHPERARDLLLAHALGQKRHLMICRCDGRLDFTVS
jgi:hypothetical protein